MTDTPTRGAHLAALDGLRGAAATLVVVCHFGLVARDRLEPGSAAFKLALLTKHVGHVPVLIFFVLSGFVLYLAFAKRPGTPYLSYLVRRVFRIYPALIAALVAAVVLRLLHPAALDGSLVRQAGVTVDALWLVPVDVVTFARHVLLLDITGRDTALDTVIWSLAIEMRFSLIFPLLAALCARSRNAIVAVAFVSQIASVALLASLGMKAPYYDGFSALGAVGVTLFYLPAFALGIAAADYYLACQRGARALPVALLTGVMVVAAVASRFTPTDLAWSIAAAALILLACRLGPVAAMATTPLGAWLGRVSYSLYLIHFPVVLIAFVSLDGLVPLAAILALALALVLVVSEVMYRVVELPGIAVGKRLTARWAVSGRTIERQ